MQRLFLVTCGTSLLTNQPLTESEKEVIRRCTNVQEENLSQSDRTVLDAALEKSRHYLDHADNNDRRNGAELTSIQAYIKKNGKRANDIYYFLHTNTYLGTRTAEVLRDYLCRKKELEINSITLHCMKINTGSEKVFRDGVRELAKWMTETIPGFREQKYSVIFNLTGGFKSLQGVLQSMGNFYADEIVYIFESSDGLIQIPRIPMKLDEALQKTFDVNLKFFRVLHSSEILKLDSLNKEEKKLVSDNGFLFDVVDECFVLSDLGVICWNEAKAVRYESTLLDSPYDQIVFSDNFKKDAKKYEGQKERMNDLNTRVDEFYLYLKDGADCLKRLDFKIIKGDTARFGSTHECDAWAASPGVRIFMHEDNGSWIFDSLQPGISH